MSQNSNREHWRERIQSAKQRLDFARAFVEEVERDMEAGAVGRDHGDEAYSRALNAELLAIQEYAKLLEAFKNLVLQGEVAGGKRPEVEESSRPRDHERDST